VRSRRSPSARVRARRRSRRRRARAGDDDVITIATFIRFSSAFCAYVSSVSRRATSAMFDNIMNTYMDVDVDGVSRVANVNTEETATSW